MYRPSLSLKLYLALLTVATVAGMLLMARQRASAHAGHDDTEIGEFDLDAPRTITPETARHIGIAVEDATARPMEDVLEFTGIVKAHPDRYRDVVSRVSGKLVAVHAQVGTKVKKGDLLAEVDSPELARNFYEARKLEVEYQKLLLEVERRKGDAARAAAEHESLRLRIEIAKRDYERSRQVAGEALAVRDVESRKGEVDRLQGELQAKKVEQDIAASESVALLKQAEALRLSRASILAINNIDATANLNEIGTTLRIHADIDGVIIRREAQPGRWLQPGDRIAALADYSVVQIEGELPESLIPRVLKRESDKVRVRVVSSPQSVFEGTLKFIGPELEPVKRTAHLLVEVANPQGVLRGEMWADLAVVIGEQKKALAVPKAAVLTQGPMHFVFVETVSGTTYQKQEINPGLRSDLYVEVKDGLAPGDRVVTQGAYSLTQLRPKAKSVGDAQKPKAHSHGQSHSHSHGHSH